MNIDKDKIDNYIYDKLDRDWEKLYKCNNKIITTAGFAVLCIKPYDKLASQLVKQAEEILTKKGCKRVENIGIEKHEDGDRTPTFVVIIAGADIPPRYWKVEADSVRQ